MAEAGGATDLVDPADQSLGAPPARIWPRGPAWLAWPHSPFLAGLERRVHFPAAKQAPMTELMQSVHPIAGPYVIRPEARRKRTPRNTHESYPFPPPPVGVGTAQRRNTMDLTNQPGAPCLRPPRAPAQQPPRHKAPLCQHCSRARITSHRVSTRPAQPGQHIGPSNCVPNGGETKRRGTKHNPRPERASPRQRGAQPPPM